MTEKIPQISSLNPIVLPDKRRVTFDMVVENLPSSYSSVTLTMPDMPGSPASSKPEAGAPGTYPNIDLSILNSQGQVVASTYIVEHKEAHTSLTLHLRRPDIDEQYTARAEMTYEDRMLQVVEVPFSINQSS